MKVICISGKAGSGKDTLAWYLSDFLEKEGKRVLITHFADLVKYSCVNFFGWDGNKDEAGRTLLQTVGTDIVRTKEPNYWVKYIADMLEFSEGIWDYVLIPDCRFPNEYRVLSYQFNTWLIKINRPDNHVLTADQEQHISETAMDSFPADINVSNSGTLGELKNRAESIIDFING